VALFMFALDRLIVTTALPAIRHDLGTGLEGLEWTVNAYTLTSAVLLLSAAAIGDRFGRRRVFVVGLAVFTAGSAAAALAPSVDALVAARALQGRRRGSDSAQPDHLQRGRNCAMRNSDPNRPK
jgi:MFS family permease